MLQRQYSQLSEITLSCSRTYVGSSAPFGKYFLALIIYIGLGSFGIFLAVPIPVNTTFSHRVISIGVILIKIAVYLEGQSSVLSVSRTTMPNSNFFCYTLPIAFSSQRSFCLKPSEITQLEWLVY